MNKIDENVCAKIPIVECRTIDHCGLCKATDTSKDQRGSHCGGGGIPGPVTFTGNPIPITEDWLADILGCHFGVWPEVSPRYNWGEECMGAKLKEAQKKSREAVLKDSPTGYSPTQFESTQIPKGSLWDAEGECPSMKASGMCYAYGISCPGCPPDTCDTALTCEDLEEDSCDRIGDCADCVVCGGTEGSSSTSNITPACYTLNKCPIGNELTCEECPVNTLDSGLTKSVITCEDIDDDICDRISDCHDCIVNGGARGLVEKDYKVLYEVLEEAYTQASEGKGKERHANGLPFEDQPIMVEARAVGIGFPSGQARKKVQEAVNCYEGEPERAIMDLLGAINYIAATILLIREGRD